MRFKPNKLAKQYGHHVGNFKQGEGLAKKKRDLERLLKKPLLADKKIGIQRKIDSITLQMAQKAQQEKENSIEAKYKYVKFVEAKKTKRLIAKLTGPELEKAKLDLFYIEHYPRDCKYISLYRPVQGDALALRDDIFSKLKQAKDDGLFENPGFVFRMNSSVEKYDSETNDQPDNNFGTDDDFFL